MDRQNFYFDQTVAGPDMSALQNSIEKSDKNLAKDILGPGIISGLEVVPNSPEDLSVRVLHGLAYDAYGQRIEVPGDGTKDCSLLVPAVEDTERWLTIVAKFSRNNHEERQDGEGNIVLYRSDESYEIAILVGNVTEVGLAEKPAAAVGETILADVKLVYGQISIVLENIDASRRMLSRTESVTDTIIGNRTVDPELEGGSNTGKLTQLLSWIVRQIKNFTGLANWYDSITDINKTIKASISSLIVSNWAVQSIPVNNRFHSVCWSPELGLFCAVATTGTGDRVITSPDGINWTVRTSAADSDWHGICWSKELGLFCAVATTGSLNQVMTSPDGINWTVRTSAANEEWWAVCWSPELSLFCAELMHQMQQL